LHIAVHYDKNPKWLPFVHFELYQPQNLTVLVIALMLQGLMKTAW